MGAVEIKLPIQVLTLDAYAKEFRKTLHGEIGEKLNPKAF
jgi:hypothetical protein